MTDPTATGPPIDALAAITQLLIQDQDGCTATLIELARSRDTAYLSLDLLAALLAAAAIRIGELTGRSPLDEWSAFALHVARNGLT